MQIVYQTKFGEKISKAQWLFQGHAGHGSAAGWEDDDAEASREGYESHVCLDG